MSPPAVLSNTSPADDLVDLVTRISPRSIMLIQAAHGAGGEELNGSYYAAARRPKSLWVVDEGGHTGGLAARPHEYEKRVIGYFDAAVRP